MCIRDSGLQLLLPQWPHPNRMCYAAWLPGHADEAPKQTAAAAEGRRTAPHVQQHAAAARGLCRGTRLGGRPPRRFARCKMLSAGDRC
eukprot:3797324-Alexandrium_andersonii.AAC.1